MTISAFTDTETLDVLQGHADLLAIADAVAATQRKRRTRLPLVRAATAIAVVVIAVAVALVSPWQGRSAGFVARALAALGDGQVIHVVSVSNVSGESVVDLQSGNERPVQLRTEVWFDGTHGLARTVASFDGRVADEELQTPQGAWTASGPVYTCAWIAAHPVQATRARVSCNASGKNGTTPRRLPEPVPALDPALSGFVTGYRDALANGTAQRDGSGTVNGRPVEWLRFQEQPSAPAGQPAQAVVERAAVDVATLKPLLVERYLNGQKTGESKVASIETIDAQQADFSRPKQAPPSPTISSVTSERTAAPEQAAAALGGRLLWAGQSLDGLALTATTVQEIVNGYSKDSGIPAAHSTGVELVYGGPAHLPSSNGYVVVREARRPEMMYRFSGPERQPAEGTMLVSGGDVMNGVDQAHAVLVGTLWYGLLAQRGSYVSIEATSKTLLLDSARSLTIFAGSR